MENPSFARRVAHWSATHRKAAIWGWVAFVVLSVAIGTAVGKEILHGADLY